MKQLIDSLAQKIGRDIADEAWKAYENMTEEERKVLVPDTNLGNVDAYRAKCLILGIDLDKIMNQYSAESIKERMRKLRRIVRKSLSR